MDAFFPFDVHGFSSRLVKLLKSSRDITLEQDAIVGPPQDYSDKKSLTDLSFGGKVVEESEVVRHSM